MTAKKKTPAKKTPMPKTTEPKFLVVCESEVQTSVDGYGGTELTEAEAKNVIAVLCGDDYSSRGVDPSEITVYSIKEVKFIVEKANIKVTFK